MPYRRILASAVLCLALGFADNSPAETVTLNPSADTSLLQPFVDNNNGAAELASGLTASRGLTRAVLKFDVASGIPAGSTITSVRFSVRVTKQPGLPQSSTFGVHRLLNDWGEGTGTDGFRVLGRLALPGEATWNSRFHGSEGWGAPGALAGTDYIATASASTLINSVATFTFASTANLVADAQAWLDDPANNFGWILISQSEGIIRTAKRFGSRESSASFRPALTIDYDPPAAEPLTAELPAVADTGLFQNNADNNLGAMEFAPIGATATGNRSRALYRFDLSLIPPNSTVLDATLNLSVTFEPGVRGELTYDVHRMLQSWNEGAGTGLEAGVGLGRAAVENETSWNHRLAPATSWGEPGAAEGTDYASAPSASAVMDEVGTFGFVDANLLADVQNWVDDPMSNFGWLVRLQDEAAVSTARKVGTREDPSPGNRPSLQVTYEPAPFITNVRRNGNQIQIEFEAYPNRPYVIERRRAFGVGGFLELERFPAEPTQRTIVASYNITTISPLFYRVRTP